MRRVLALLLLAPFLGAGEAPDAGLPLVEGDAILAHVKWLSDDDRSGRSAGSEGEIAAADYAARHFEQLGLQPSGDAGGFFQAFSLPQGFTVRKETSLVATREGKSCTLTYDEDLKPLSLSGPGDVTAEAVFAGYGIAAPDLGYDDYEGLDVKGKVVVVLRHAPAFDSPKSPFSKPEARRQHTVFDSKVRVAIGAGAAALVIVNDPDHAIKPKDDVAMQDVGGNAGPIPVLHVTYRAGRELAKICGLNLQREQNSIDKSLEPRSRLLEGVTIRVNAALEASVLPVRNVCALLTPLPKETTPREGGGEVPPPPSRAIETLIVGAHTDHVGLGAYGSLAGSKGKGAIHNGADDNASGTSSVLEIASFLVARRPLLRRNVLFLLFTAEEMGLLGSKHYVGVPVIPLEECVAMVNLDMVGRLERGRLQVGGVGTSPIFPDLIEAKNRAFNIKTKLNPGGRAPSDNTSFYDKGMPVLFFHTGLHSDYHRPSDDWNKIDKRGIEKVARLAAEVCLDLATRETRPPFTRADASGFDSGPFLGLSLEQRPDGVYVTFVEEKSPADRGGIDAGDKVEEFEDQPIPSLTAFNQVHSNCKPKQAVTIVVRRGPRLVKKKVVLGD